MGNIQIKKSVAGWILVTLLTPCFIVSPVSAQTVDTAYQKIKKERDIAMQSGDDKVYGRYTTDNFWVVMPDGSVQTKQDRLKSLIAMKMKRTSSTAPSQGQPKPPRDEKVTMYGDTIVVNWIGAAEGGKDARFSETWVKQDGTWKCAAAHVSMLQSRP